MTRFGMAKGAGGGVTRSTPDRTRARGASRVEVDVGKDRAELLQGTLDLLILRVLRSEELHGWGISKRIRQLSDDVLEVNQGSLYPALYRLRDRGLIEGSWGVSPEGRRARFYRLTAAGRQAVAAEHRSWQLFSAAVDRVIEAT